MFTSVTRGSLFWRREKKNRRRKMRTSHTHKRENIIGYTEQKLHALTNTHTYIYMRIQTVVSIAVGQWTLMVASHARILAREIGRWNNVGRAKTE